MHQRLVTILQSKSPEVDAFMSLTSHEGLLYSHAGWYADLGPLMKGETAPDCDLADCSPALIQGKAYGGKLIGIPLNIAGPIIFYRKDIFQKCGVTAPKSLAKLEQAAARINACEPHMVPWVTRGLAPALPYTFSNVLHNFGADYCGAAGKPDLCVPKAVSAVARYADMLRTYGPPGVINHSYVQIADLYDQGRAGTAFESSNEFTPIAAGAGARVEWNLVKSGHWYDIFVEGPDGETTRLAGHVETGRPSITDPAATAPVVDRRP